MENRLIYIIPIFIFAIACSNTAVAQPENVNIAAGNSFYKKNQFDKAIAAYQKALEINPTSSVARYNLAAAKYRLQQFEEAEKEYANTAEKSTDNDLKAKSVYNEGVALTKQKKLLESIARYKTALLLNPNDADVRFNLQKALEELRKQQKQKEPEKKKDQQKQQKEKEQKPPPANKKQMEQWLQSLKQKEQEVQQKMQQQKRRSSSQPEKDW